jgi:purine-binding chemotaxis protein CheW
MSQVEFASSVGRASARVSDEPLNVLMIGLGREILAIETEIVREIIDPVPTTKVPGARSFLPALINVRGNVIPLADLALRLGLQRTAATEDSRFVVIEISIDEEPVTVGIMADKVYEVADVMPSQSLPTPRVGAQWDPDLIRFIVKWNDDFVIVPDLQALLNPQD